MRQRHNHDVHREVTPETVLGFTYTDKDGDLWAKHPSGYWICGDGSDPSDDSVRVFKEQWEFEQWEFDLFRGGPKSWAEERWGPLVENFLTIAEQP